jgi:hypothetical protein
LIKRSHNALETHDTRQISVRNGAVQRNQMLLGRQPLSLPAGWTAKTTSPDREQRGPAPRVIERTGFD